MIKAICERNFYTETARAGVLEIRLRRFFHFSEKNKEEI